MPGYPAHTAAADTLETSERSKVTAQEATMKLEQSYVAAAKGAVEFNLKLVDIAEDNINATFDFARQLPHVKSPSVLVEISTEHARKQFERLKAQTQELTGLAQKTITETAESWKTLNSQSM